MTTRSRRLAGPTPLIGVDWEPIFVVPPAATAIVKSVRLVNRLGVPCVFDVAEDLPDSEHAFFWAETMPAGAIVLDSSWWVMEHDSTLYARQSVDGALTIWLSGALLPA